MKDEKEAVSYVRMPGLSERWRSDGEAIMST